MNWLISISAAGLAAVVGAGGAFALAAACINWYQISSFEGKSGYFAIGLTLAGAAGGAVLGLIAARMAAHFASGSTGVQILVSVSAILLVLLAATGAAYTRADIPPTIEGHQLELEVEVKLPESQVDRPRWTKDQARALISSMPKSGGMVRVSRSGEVDRESLHRDGAHWAVLVRAPLFTSRGARILTLTLGEIRQSFWMILAAKPSKADLGWSPWLPRAPQPNWGPLTYRCRVRLLDQSDSR